ncbi:MAG: hypothetical protein HXS54_16140 [Theionarchaea archaeon]|nr:hypothetical protein [Theionarchaea archaeon]
MDGKRKIEKDNNLEDYFRFKKNIIFKEWELLAREIEKHTNKINVTRNFFIVTFVGLIGYILSETESNPVCGNIIFNGHRSIPLLPIFTVVYFALNEAVIHYRIWGDLMRLFHIDKVLRETKMEDSECEIAKFEPSALPDDERRKLDLGSF